MSVTQTFFYDLIAGTFKTVSTIDDELAVLKMADRIREKTGRADDVFPDAYAEAVSYTVDLEFRWPEDIPEAYRSFQTWWEMRQEGKSEAECYVYFVGHVPTRDLLPAWRTTVREALRPWKPKVETAEGDLTEEEKTDPNS